MDLNTVPTEILSLILSHLHVPDLQWPDDVRHVASARLVCRKWNALARPHLFRSIRIGYYKSSIPPWDTLLGIPEVRNAIQGVTILNSPVPKIDEWDDVRFYTLRAAYLMLLECAYQIANLPKLWELDIRAHLWCDFLERNPQIKIDWLPDPYPPFKDERSFLVIFYALQHRLSTIPHATPIRSLALTNPQDMLLPELVESDLFRDITTHIDTLYLLVTEESLAAFNWVFAPLPNRRKYEVCLQQELLPHLSSQLVTLTLAFYEPWGLVPAYFNPRHLSFPRLRTLTLAEFVIGHDDHLEWVLAQTPLIALRLHRCYIASHLRLQLNHMESWNARTDDWERKPLGSFGFRDDSRAVYTYPGTWAAVFRQMSTRLTNLTGFHLENDKPRFWFRDHGMKGAKLSKRRYIVCDVGLTHPGSPWAEADGDGEMEFGNNDPEGYPCDVKMSLNRAEETEQEDGEALEALLETIRQRCVKYANGETTTP